MLKKAEPPKVSRTNRKRQRNSSDGKGLGEGDEEGKLPRLSSATPTIEVKSSSEDALRRFIEEAGHSAAACHHRDELVALVKDIQSGKLARRPPGGRSSASASASGSGSGTGETGNLTIVQQMGRKSDNPAVQGAPPSPLEDSERAAVTAAMNDPQYVLLMKDIAFAVGRERVVKEIDQGWDKMTASESIDALSKIKNSRNGRFSSLSSNTLNGLRILLSARKFSSLEGLPDAQRTLFQKLISQSKGLLTVLCVVNNDQQAQFSSDIYDIIQVRLTIPSPLPPPPPLCA